MPKKENTNSETNQNKVREPEKTYGEKRIVFFNSFEEMNEYDHRYYAGLTPEERLETVLEMRNTVWPDRDTAHPFGRHIHFQHLIVNKMLVGRPQDKADVDMLQKIRRHK